MLNLLTDKIQAAYECHDWESYQLLLEELSQLIGEEN